MRDRDTELRQAQGQLLAYSYQAFRATTLMGSCLPSARLALPDVRFTTEAVPAVMASTCEWISCFDSSILFFLQALEACKQKGSMSALSIFGNSFPTPYLKGPGPVQPILTASWPRGGRVSKSSRVAWAACTACMLELMVPVSACWAEVCKARRGGEKGQQRA